MLPLILACTGQDPADRADAWMGPFDSRHGIVQVGVDDPERVRLVVGSPVWNGVDLGAVMLGCGVHAGSVVTATVHLETGVWPHEVDEVEGASASEPCVRAALTHLPFDAPDAPDATDLLRLRIVSGVGEQPPISRRRAPDGDLSRLTPPPPSYRAAMSPEAIDVDRLVIDGDHVRWPGRDLPVGAGHWASAAAVATLVTCPSDAPTLVRATLVFAAGVLVRVETSPEDDCVEDAVEEAAGRIAAVEAGGRRAGDWSRLILVLDVPVGT